MSSPFNNAQNLTTVYFRTILYRHFITLLSFGALISLLSSASNIQCTSCSTISSGLVRDSQLVLRKMSEAEVGRSESQDTAEPVKRLIPPGRLIMLSTVLFFVGYSYGVNEGFGIPLLLEAGMEERYAPFVFGISSVINVILGGYLGSSSDRCTSSLGRRRPYIIGLTIILLIATVFYPSGEDLSDAFQLENNAETIYVICHTGICVMIFDITLDMIHSLGRSYLFDSVTVQQASSGNAAFSFMISTGSFFGSLLSAVDWKDVLHLSSGNETKVVFATAVVITVVCSILTLSSVKEPKIGKDGKIDFIGQTSTWKKYFLCCNYCAFDLYDTDDYITTNVSIENKVISKTNTTIQDKDTSKINTSVQSKDISQADETTPLLDKTPQQNNNHTNPCKYPCYLFMKAYEAVQDIIYFIKSLSNAMLWLWLAQVLQWTTMLSLLFLITNFVAIFIYDGEPDADDGSKEKEDYDKGVRMGLYCKCIGFAASLCYSVFLYSKYSRRFYTRTAHISIHILTCLSTGVLIFNKSIYVVASLHVIFGFYYSWILIVPLTLLQSYKENNLLFRKEFTDEFDAVGRAVAFLFTTIFFAQIIFSFSMGFIVEAYGSEAGIMVTITITTFLATLILSFLPLPSNTGIE